MKAQIAASIFLVLALLCNLSFAEAPQKRPEKKISVLEKFNLSVKSENEDNASPLSTANKIELVKERKAEIKKLIEQSPSKAIEEHQKTLDAIGAKSLPDEIAEHLEKEVSGTGEIIVIAGDDFDEDGNNIKSFTERTAVINGKRYKLFVDGYRIAMGCKKGLSIDGIAVDDSLALSNRPLRKLKKQKKDSREDEDGHAYIFQGKVLIFDSEENAEAFNEVALKAEKKPDIEVSYPSPAEFGGTYK